jgi:hypothetical protein
MAKARLVAGAFDSGGHPVQQYELCLSHGSYIAQREQKRGRNVLFLLDQEEFTRLKCRVEEDATAAIAP